MRWGDEQLKMQGAVRCQFHGYATWVIAQGPTLSLMLCHHRLEILNDFENGVLPYHFHSTGCYTLCSLCRCCALGWEVARPDLFWDLSEACQSYRPMTQSPTDRKEARSSPTITGLTCDCKYLRGGNPARERQPLRRFWRYNMNPQRRSLIWGGFQLSVCEKGFSNSQNVTLICKA